MLKVTLILLLGLIHLPKTSKTNYHRNHHSIRSIIFIVSQTVGVTTRYWDCCKPSCGWPGKASVSSPVQTCAQDGVTPVSSNTRSGCNTDGTAFACNNQQPWSVNDTLSYGFAAASIQVKKKNY